MELGKGERQTAPFIAALLHLVGLDSSLESRHLPKPESNTLQRTNNQQQEKTTQNRKVGELFVLGEGTKIRIVR